MEKLYLVIQLLSLFIYFFGQKRHQLFFIVSPAWSLWILAGASQPDLPLQFQWMFMQGK